MNPEELDHVIADLQRGVRVEERFRVLFDRYYRRVYQFFCARGFRSDDCLDLTQETFLGVYRDIGAFRREASFETWLFGMVANIYRNRLRSLRAQKRSAVEVPIDTEEKRPMAEALPAAERVGEEDPSEHVLRREREARLEQAIDDLPPQMRRALILNVYRGLSYRDVAESLGISINTVKSQLHEGRKRLLGRMASAD